ncbi:MAG: sigma-70 family RNA polymerase sigma factor [Deltaproteobacteria bacterium]|nr:sigma-70 family RNA polymerase sigma factor [Deltaproteobacteria bacterium]
MTDEYDFRTIYDEYHPKIVRYLTRVVGATDAEDIAQEVFDRVHRNLGDFRGQSKLSTWIYRIATNAAIDSRRSAAYRYTKELFPLEEAVDAACLPDPADHDDEASDRTLIRREMSDCVKEFIDRLPPDDRTVIVLSELEGLSNEEIADVLEISLNNAKIRLHRARAKLRTALEKGCVFYRNEENVFACDRKPAGIASKPPSDDR